MTATDHNNGCKNVDSIKICLDNVFISGRHIKDYNLLYCIFLFSGFVTKEIFDMDLSFGSIRDNWR